MDNNKKGGKSWRKERLKKNISQESEPSEETPTPVTAGISESEPSEETPTPVTAGISESEPSEETPTPVTAGISESEPSEETSTPVTAAEVEQMPLETEADTQPGASLPKLQANSSITDVTLQENTTGKLKVLQRKSSESDPVQQDEQSVTDSIDLLVSDTNADVTLESETRSSKISDPSENADTIVAEATTETVTDTSQECHSKLLDTSEAENKTESTEEERVDEEEAAAKQKQHEEDMLFLDNYILECGNRLAEKATLRASNIAIAKDRPELNTTKLDSSLKKNTALIKKLRNLTESQYPSLEKEIAGLNLSRYVGEAANALLDARLKMADIAACVAMCSNLHQRYVDFAPALLAGFAKIFKEKPDEKVSNLSKLRVDLRLYAELVSAGIFSQKEGLPLLGTMLTGLVNGDKEGHRNVSVIVSFCRFCGEDYLGILPVTIDALAKALNREREVPRSMFLTKDRQKNVRQLMKDYFGSLSKHILLLHKGIEREERHNRRLLETRGEVDDARLAAVATEAATLNKLLQHAAAMAEYLHEQVPQLPKQKFVAEGGGLVLGEDGTLVNLAREDAGNLWEDEDAKAFYTCLPQLKALLPSILYSESAAATPTAEVSVEGEAKLVETEQKELGAEDQQPEEEEEEEVGPDPNELAKQEEEQEKQDNEDEEKGAGTSKSSSQKTLFSYYLTSLSNCISRDLMDAASLEFCLKFNTKPFRRKLARALFLVPRNRQDLLPFYSRLVASLKPLMPDLPHELIDRLKLDFRYQVKKKDQINLESKLKVCRFLGELCKFGVMDGGELLVCLRMLLYNFKHHHVEMACAILETAGRFLYRTPGTYHLTKLLLEQMMRKKTVMSFEARYCTIIENAYYYVNPPESSRLLVVEPLPPMLLYIRHLTTEILSKTTVEKTLRQIRCLDWSDTETSNYCVCRLTAAWEVKYYNIRCLANLVSGLVLYHEWVGPTVVDGVLEDVRVGLESNFPHLNQRRLASVKYLSELYNYKVIESAVIFKVLYSIMSFGAGSSSEHTEEQDPPEQLLRLRLVTTILDTCGVFFSSGLSKRKLDCFITYFQYYYLYKRVLWTGSDGFPAEYDQAVRECLAALRPQLTLCDTIEEAFTAVNTLNAHLINKAITQAPELRKFFRSEDEGTLSTIAEIEDGDGGGVHEFAELLDDDADDDEDERERAGYDDQHHRADTQEDDDDATQEERQTQDDDGTQGSAKEGGTADSSESDSDEQDGTKKASSVMMTLQPIKCEEDDNFMSAFDRLMSDTLQEHSRDPRPNPTPLALPIATRGIHKKTYDQLLDENRDGQEEQQKSGGGGNVVKFVLMARNSSNKQQQQQQLTTIAIPEDSEMVTKMRNREKQEEEERRNVKRVTLEMTERQEEEEAAQELLLQRNTLLSLHRERRTKYQHPKGAPDADLIFGRSNANR